MNTDLDDRQIDRYIPMTSITSQTGVEIADDIYYYNVQIVNICFVGQKDNWVLVDAGMPKSAPDILDAVKNRFGRNTQPKAIILTHGHFDHVGALVDLVKEWNVPVYAHELELPYLTGKQSYPEPDTTVEGGILAKISNLYPNEPINLGNQVDMLSSDGTIPFMPHWKWIHTPGHSPGHVSFYREKDGTLIAGDAFITVRQDSLFKVLTQKQEVCGPPRYLTTDWQAAFESVQKLNDLHSRIAITGHGSAIAGQSLTDGLQKLVNEFNKVAVPNYGRFINKTN